MSTINLTESEYYGRTSRARSRARRKPRRMFALRLLAGRQDRGVRTFGGKLVRTFLCPCGRRRRVEVAA